MPNSSKRPWEATIEVPLIDLAAAGAELGPELTGSLQSAVERGDYVLGAEVTAFEREFASYCGARHCVGVGSGLDALTLCLQAWGIGPGDEVIVPAYTFVATWIAVWRVGARPVGVDVSANAFTLEPDLLEDAITSNTRAIFPVHLFGTPAVMTEIVGIADRHGLRVLEDAAQAHGARYAGRRVGSLADAAAFSFYPTKNLGALGDGGAIVTDDENLARKCRLLRSYGCDRRNVSEVKGVNSRLDTLQAAVLRIKLARLDEWNKRRSAIAMYYRDALADIEQLVLPTAPAESERVWHLFVVNTPNRDLVLSRLHRQGVGALVHYDPLPHLTPAFAADGWMRGAFPTAERAASRAISLPLYPQLEPKACRRVVDAVRASA